VLDDPDEMVELQQVKEDYEQATGYTIGNQPAAPPPAPPASQPDPSSGSQPSSSGQKRVHAQDVQLTFNNASWIPAGLTADEWFRTQAAVILIDSFIEFGRTTFPSRFTEKLQHTTQTLEVSPKTIGTGEEKVHLHVQFTFHKAIDRTGLKDFMFGTIYPHVDACLHLR
jgi:hypothetical protein